MYDLAGRELARLVEGPLPAGRHSVVWDGRSAHGEISPAGIYIARLLATPAAGATPHFDRAIKLLLLK